MRDRGGAELDVDARFLLANERTLLAWERTALGVIAAGVATFQLSEVDGRAVIAAALAFVGCLLAIAGGVRYVVADRALRAGRLPPTGRAPLALVLVVVAIGVGAAVASVLT